MKSVGKLYTIIIVFVGLLASCGIKIKPNEEDGKAGHQVEVQRYDRLESRYLTTGDFSALQQMNMEYPMETRTLIEDVLQIGEVNDPEINSKFLNFYQDTILQSIIVEAEYQYADMSDINSQLSKAFWAMRKLLPAYSSPVVYAQIGALNQSIVIGDNAIGISLDKYLGKDYGIYSKYYSEQQRKAMSREYIVPDALSFYILSLYPLHSPASSTQMERDMHMGKVMWTVNHILGKPFFSTKFITTVDAYMRKHPKMAVDKLLTSREPLR